MNGVLTLKMQLTPLQYSDTRGQQLHDAEAVFKKGSQFPIKFGTESGTDTDLHGFLRRFAREYDHTIHFARGNWIAVDKSIIQKNSVVKGQIFSVDNGRLKTRQHDRVSPTLAFTHADPRLGRIALAGTHYSTRGREEGDPHFETNEEIAVDLGNWMRTAGSKSALAFLAGDFNMLDNVAKQDWAFGEQFTSIADELGKHKNTGHGPIDGFCSYNKDRRVKAKYHRVLRDNEMKLFSDHYVSRCAWSVKHKR